MPVLALSAFAASALSLLAAARLLLFRDLDARLAEGEPSKREPRQGLAYLAQLDRMLGPRLEQLMGRRRVQGVEQRLLAAGVFDRQAARDHLGRRATNLTLATIGGIVLAASGSPIMLPLLPLAVWLIGERSLDAGARKRGREIQTQLPDFLDVVAVMLSAGLGFRQAMRRVADAMPGPVSDEIDFVLREMELGAPLREALTELRDRNQSDALDTFVAALLQADELGSPLTEVMLSLAEEVRREAAQAARQRAARTTPRVSLVLTLVFVPASIILLVAALLFGSEIELGEIFTG